LENIKRGIARGGENQLIFSIIFRKIFEAFILTLEKSWDSLLVKIFENGDWAVSSREEAIPEKLIPIIIATRIPMIMVSF